MLIYFYIDMLSVRIGKDLKEKMFKYKHVNWSEVIRRNIKRELKNLERRDLARALLLNERYLIKPDEGFSSVKEIRKWRELKWSGG